MHTPLTARWKQTIQGCWKGLNFGVAFGVAAECAPVMVLLRWGDLGPRGRPDEEGTKVAGGGGTGCRDDTGFVRESNTNEQG